MKTRNTLEALEPRIAPAFASSTVLANLAPSFGLETAGEGDLSQAGTSVANAGDVNGDGVDDLIIGAPGTANGPGAAYVLFGGAGGRQFPPSLAALESTAGFAITGVQPGDFAGCSVAGAGDINGDGYDDVIIGARFAREGASVPGAAYVVFGRPAFPSELPLASLNGANGFKLTGAGDGDEAGLSVGSAGDVNGDGFGDIVVGAPQADENGADRGAAYVLFGKANGFAPARSLGTVANGEGFRVRGFGNGELTGTAVAGAGDLNGDGFDDVLVGAPLAENGAEICGAVYVVFGTPAPVDVVITVSDLDGAAGFRVFGANDADLTGFAVASAGDVNGDGFADFLVGSPFADEGGNARGAAHVLFGHGGAYPQSFTLQGLAPTFGFRLFGVANADHAGFAVAAAGDVNGDGFDDVIIGADRALEAGTPHGAAYVFFGHTGAFPTATALAQLDGSNGFRLAGAGQADRLGASVAALGDVNGDGCGDLLIGAPGADKGGNSRGAVFLVYGQSDVAMGFAKNGRAATFVDLDGDVVTVKVSKGRLSAADFDFRAGVWQGLNFADDGAEFANANVTVSVRPSPTGDGLVNLGALRAEGVDLGVVKLRGDLGQIDAGDADARTPAVKTLAVNSLGSAGGAGQPLGTIDPTRSDLFGALGKLRVAGDVAGTVNVTGGLAGRIGAVFIGGDLDGSSGDDMAGLLRASGSIGSVTVAGDVRGGAALSGILSGDRVGAVKIGGSLTSAAAAPPVQISALGSLAAKTAADAVAIAAITVNGDVSNARMLAGYTTSGGALNPDASVGPVLVRGDWSASSLAAGVQDSGLPGYGVGDALIAGDQTSQLIATIARVTILGSATGSAAGFDHYGITAGRVLRVQVGAALQPLTTGSDSVLLDPVNNDFRVRDFA